MHTHIHTQKTDLNQRHKHTHTINTNQNHQKIKVMFISACQETENILIDVRVRKKKQSVSDKLMDYTLKNAEHLHFLLCTGMLDNFIKNTKIKFKKTPTIQNNSLKGMCCTGEERLRGEGRGQSESASI